MDFLNNLYESDYFGIGLFAVIAFLVVTFLIVLFFGKKDEKKRKLEATQKIAAEDTFKETSAATPVEIPANPNPATPINLEPAITDVPPVAPVAPVEPVIPVAPTEPVIAVEDNNEYVDNLTIDEPVKPLAKEEPVSSAVTPVVTPSPSSIELEPTKIEIPSSSAEVVSPVINEPTPIIKEEEPKLQINEEPVIDTYYKPVEKVNSETINVPNIDFDALAKSISQELDELEEDSKRHDEVKVTPMSEITNRASVNSPQTFSSVYVEPTAKETPKSKIELPKKIELPARKGE